ncbi:MAG: hypothetical protein EBX41_10285, partial [Chitinophagia bacterium]|nr:hypothetical protein [Chitinophagia bacterium]
MAIKKTKTPIPISSLVPPSAAAYCIALLKQYQLKIRLVKPRATILGTYIRKEQGGQLLAEEIRINANLNKQLFITVLLHEIAHWLVANSPQRNSSPHGTYWQEKFKQLMEPVLTLDNFSARQLEHLNKELYGERTSACFSSGLLHALRHTDDEAAAASTLEIKALELGTIFIHNGNPFQLIEKRRTRALCLQLFEGRNLLVQLSARVSLPDHSDLLRLHKLSLAYQPLETVPKGKL